MSRVPLIIAHRGAPAVRLEHTADSYLTAIEMGADWIEPDVVASKDGVLVIRHDNEIGETTNVAEHPEFADRRRTQVIDGRTLDGWFVEDFTWAELQTLRCRERMPNHRPDNSALDGTAGILRLEDAFEISAAHGIGVYVETKHPSHFAALGLDLTQMLIEAFESAGRNTEGSADVIQCFETANLQWARSRTPLTLVQLLDNRGAPADFVAAGDSRTFADLTTPEGLEWVATYADGIGPHKNLVIDPENWPQPTDLVRDAHAAGLVVHPWTMRDEAAFRPDGVDVADEYTAFYDAGVDGLFSDLTSSAVSARRSWLDRSAPPA